MPTNAIAYLRVSTDKQADSGLGLAAQRAAVETLAARLGCTLRQVFVDAAVSSVLSILDRPVLTEAVAVLQRGDVFLVAKRDRLARDVYEVCVIERAVLKQGARIVSAAGEGTDGDPEDPTSALLRGMIDLFAQYERRVIQARTKTALAAKRAKGERVGTLPFGFQLAPDGVQLVAAPAEQRIVARIRELKDRGRTTRQIADALRQDGLTTRRGTPMRFEYVARVLRAKAS